MAPNSHTQPCVFRPHLCGSPHFSTLSNTSPDDAGEFLSSSGLHLHFFPLSKCPSSSFSLSHCWDESTSHDYPQPSSFFFLSSHPPLDYPLHAHIDPNESISLHFILHSPTHPGVLKTLWCKRCSKNGWLALFCISCCWLCWSWCVTLLKHRLW